MILPDFTPARHSPPILWPAPVWWLRLTPTPARPVYALCPSLSLIILMMRYVRNVKLEQNYVHQKEFFLQQQYMIWSFNVIVMRPIYSLGWMFSSLTRVHGRVTRVAIKVKINVNTFSSHSVLGKSFQLMSITWFYVVSMYASPPLCDLSKKRFDFIT